MNGWMDGKIERVVAACAFPKLCPVVTFGAQEGQGSPLPARALNRLKWQRLCWGTGNTPLVSMRPSVLGETDLLELKATDQRS